METEKPKWLIRWWGDDKFDIAEYDQKMENWGYILFDNYWEAWSVYLKCKENLNVRQHIALRFKDGPNTF